MGTGLRRSGRSATHRFRQPPNSTTAMVGGRHERTAATAGDVLRAGDDDPVGSVGARNLGIQFAGYVENIGRGNQRPRPREPGGDHPDRDGRSARHHRTTTPSSPWVPVTTPPIVATVSSTPPCATSGFYAETGVGIPAARRRRWSRNRLPNCISAADSVDAWFRSHRSRHRHAEAVDPDDHANYNPPGTHRYDTGLYNTALYGATLNLNSAVMRAASFFYSGITVNPTPPGSANRM